MHFTAFFGSEDIQALSRIFQRLQYWGDIEPEELARLIIDEYAANPADDDTVWRNCSVALNRRAIHSSFLKASPTRKTPVGEHPDT